MPTIWWVTISKHWEQLWRSRKKLRATARRRGCENDHESPRGQWRVKDIRQTILPWHQVNYRLGEIRGDKETEAGEALERDRKLHLFAVEYMMCSQAANFEQSRTTRTAEVAVRANLNSFQCNLSWSFYKVAPEVLEIDSNIQRFTDEAEHYRKPIKENENRVFPPPGRQTLARVSNLGKEWRIGLQKQVFLVVEWMQPRHFV